MMTMQRVASSAPAAMSLKTVSKPESAHVPCGTAYLLAVFSPAREVPLLASKRRHAVLSLLLGLTLAMAAPRVAADESSVSEREQAGRILEDAGVRGGLIVHLGVGDGKLTAALRASEGCLVHGLDADPRRVEQARQYVRSQGWGGEVSIDLQRGKRLPYVDNLVNLVVSQDLGEITMDEVMRVLVPGGVAYIERNGAWARTLKPRPPNIDEWTHTLYDATGNAVGKDSVVGPPHHIQWVGPPRRARQHEHLGSVSSIVSSGGRIFSIEDRGATASVLLPDSWLLVARDAFNGLVLWKRSVGPWEDHLRSFRMGPPDIARRLVAVGDRVYVTLGYGQPLTALDAATGRTLKVYEGTDGAKEILCCSGVLYVVADDEGAEKRIAKRRGAGPLPNDRRILATEADTGRTLWTKWDAETAQLMPMTLAADGGRLFFQNPDAVFCLDAGTARELWRAARPAAVERPGFSAPTLVVYNDVVLSADRAAPRQLQEAPKRKHKTSWVDAPLGELVALSAETGKKLWSCPCRECFNAPVDVLVADGLVWTGELVVAAEPGITVGRDPATGEIRRRRPADQAFFQVGMPHHRCYRNRAADRYLILGRAGVEFIDVATGEALPNHWIRGTCQHGILPCNGLLYVPPHSCACYSQAKLNGFYALAPQGESEPPQQARQLDDRLQRGPAFGQAIDPSTSVIDQGSIDWPTYRHDASRSGCTQTSVPPRLRLLWKRDLGGTRRTVESNAAAEGPSDRALSSATIAGGAVFVASIADHTVHALDAGSGDVLWRYTSGGRVDSPPTACKGLVVFGSADGSVYCLRASDGQLVWRFRAAPEDRRIVAYGQLESVWPVHGSVLIREDVIYFAAGRSSYLDSGIYLYRLDLKTGNKLSETRLDSRDPKTGRQPKGAVEMFDLPGALPDVLSADDAFVYMRHTKFDRQGVVQTEGGRHLFCPTGFLDDSWWHRSYWVFSDRFYSGYRDWFRAGREAPGGRLLVFSQSSIYGYGRKPDYYYWSTPQEYHLFAAAKTPQIVDSPQKRPRLPEWGQREIQYDWSAEIPFHARAMVLAADVLFLAGPPAVVDERQAFERRNDAAVRSKLAEQASALEGQKGALLWAVSASDGEQLAEYRLESLPAWDGMAAAGGRLYLTTTDGEVHCLGGQ